MFSSGGAFNLASDFFSILSLRFPLEPHGRERNVFVALLDCLFHDFIGMHLSLTQLVRVKKNGYQVCPESSELT